MALGFVTGGGLFAASEPKDAGFALTCTESEIREGVMLVSMTVALPWAAAIAFDDEVGAYAFPVIS